MAIKFQINVPLTLTFPFGDFREINGQYGQQFQYTVELAGQQDKLFATPALHQKLQTAGVGPGTVLTVAKIEAEGNRKGWVVVQPEGVEEAQEAPGGNGVHQPTQTPPSPTPAPTEPLKATNGYQPQASHPDFSDMQTLMGHCLRASWSAWQGVDDGDFEFRSEDVRGVGITLFLECARKGVLPQAVEEGLPF